MPLHWCDNVGNDVEHANTDHYGVNVTLVAGERLDAVGAPDVPQLGRRVAGARHKSFLGKHHVDCQPLSNVSKIDLNNIAWGLHQVQNLSEYYWLTVGPCLIFSI